MKTIPKEEMKDLVGRELGPSHWLMIDQARIDKFADATLDHQFIHVDPERAAKTQMGGAIAHGFLTLSLISHLTMDLLVVPENLTMVFNYGLDRVRFLQPVKVNQEVRAHMKIEDVQEKKPGQFRVASKITIEIKGEEKPALVADSVAMYFAD